MRIVNLNSEQRARRITVMSYGGSRSGKTHWAASFPRPLFLSDATEGGWVTIENMDPDSFFEPGRPPLVWAVESIADMEMAKSKIDPLIKSGDVKTIVVDSLTFYSDLMLAILIGMQGAKVDNRQVYGILNNKLRELRVDLHKKNVNVVWLALEKKPDPDNIGGGGTPLIPGQQADKFYAGCDFIFYHRQIDDQQGQRWQLHTRKYGPYIAGGRDGGRLPPVIEFPTYPILIEMLKGASLGAIDGEQVVDEEPSEPVEEASPRRRNQNNAQAKQQQQPTAPAPGSRFVIR